MTRREERLAKLKARQESKGVATREFAYQVPKDVPFYKMREGQNLIDIIPYRVSNKMNPAIRVDGFEIGDEDYYQLLHVHKGIGVNNNEYLCLNRMFGKPCPVCEAQKGLWEVSRDSAKALFPTEYAVYNVIDLLEPEKGIQVWKAPKKWVEDELAKLASMKSKGGDPILYGDWELGWSIEFYGIEEKYKKSTYIKPKNFNFVKREKQYDESIVDKAYPIDQYYNIKSYDVMYNDYNGIQNENDVVPEKVEDIPEDPQEKQIETIQKEAEKAKEEQVQRTSRRERRRPANQPKLCPMGFNWGECDNHDDCSKCSDDDYNKCADIQDGVMTVDEL